MMLLLFFLSGPQAGGYPWNGSIFSQTVPFKAFITEQ